MVPKGPPTLRENPGPAPFLRKNKQQLKKHSHDQSEQMRFTCAVQQTHASSRTLFFFCYRTEGITTTTSSKHVNMQIFKTSEKCEHVKRMKIIQTAHVS